MDDHVDSAVMAEREDGTGWDYFAAGWWCPNCEMFEQDIDDTA